MTEFIFGMLEKVGFTHPLHPAATHIPMGMVMGCFFFGLLIIGLKKNEYRRTALHCSVLALIFIVPTVIAGILDWQHFYGGTWQPLIVIKMILAVVLTALLVWSIQLNRKEAEPRMLFIVYVLCLVCVTGLGFSGGELIYGG